MTPERKSWLPGVPEAKLASRHGPYAGGELDKLAKARGAVGIRWKNTSDYPDAWAQAAFAWLLRRAGNPRVNRVEIRRGELIPGSGHAYLGGGPVFLRLRRREPRDQWKDHRYSWDPERRTSGPLEAFVFLAAHELHHSTAKGAEEARTLPRSRYEFRCNEAGSAAVREYRETMRPILLAEYAKSLRRDRKRLRISEAREVAKRAAAKDPDLRIAKLLERREAWEAKASRAARAIAKINRRVGAIEAARRRSLRMAAKGGAS